jgi:hypothetical protein
MQTIISALNRHLKRYLCDKLTYWKTKPSKILIYENQSILQNDLFMNPEIKTWLFDILQSIKEIESYYKDGPTLFIQYQKEISRQNGRLNAILR